jgi:hypothetical protein
MAASLAAASEKLAQPPPSGDNRLLTKLFGLVQLDFAGTLPPADGRYLARGGDTGEEESVLVLRTVGAPPAPPKRRRRRAEGAGPEPAELPLTRVTAIRAFAPFESETAAREWLNEVWEAEDTVDVLVDEAIGILNRALHAQAVSAADPRGGEVSIAQATRIQIGFASGEEAAKGHLAEGRRVLAADDRRSRRRRRDEDLRPQERVAAVLRGREQLDACETLLLRARADLDAGREREAALQLRVGVEALLVELRGALADPGHDRDLAALDERKAEVGDAANAALKGGLDPAQLQAVRELLDLCERVLRRRRVLRG